MIEIGAELPEHDPAVERLLDDSFAGAWRHKTCHALRAGRAPVRGASLVARTRRRIVGTVRFWTVSFGRGQDGLMLGPLAVDAKARTGGLGARLVEEGLAFARRMGHRRVFLVGDAPYYSRFGFSAAPMGGLSLPGPVDAARLLGLELTPGAFDGVRGRIQPLAA
jgi:predicted N-acetyltransferase YhbS